MKERLYTLTELVSFGNYLLSDRRRESIDVEENITEVHDCDLANWDAGLDVAVGRDEVRIFEDRVRSVEDQIDVLMRSGDANEEDNSQK